MKTKSTFTFTGRILILSLTAVLTMAVISCRGRNQSSENASIRSEQVPPLQAPYNIINGDTVWFRVDTLPVFPGGNKALSEYLARNMRYPETAVKKKIQGRVVVGFVLTKDCRVTSAKVTTRIFEDCDLEALRVINSLPVFEKPAMVKGRPVAYHFTLPVHFVLQ